MLTTNKAPGVYVEDLPPTARPITGVGTSTAAFLGMVPDNMPMPAKPGGSGTYAVYDAGKPVEVTSWTEFTTRFGEIGAQNRDLAHAVYGFFNNGGTRCFVQRVATAAALTDPGSALEKFEGIDDISIVAIPGAITQQQHQALVDHCRKLEDRVAILDGADDANFDVTKIRPVGQSTNASFAALYYPWILVADPSAAGKPKAVAPSGHMAGIWARSDATRGVHKAPANEPVAGALGTATAAGAELLVGPTRHGVLNDAGINVLRVPRGAVTVWGARTLAATPDFRYLSTRRYYNFLRESIIDGTSWVVFEPNSPALWARIRRTLNDFLLGQWQAGALFGETPAQAFQVRCDAETNPPDVRETGQVVTEIGLVIVKSAEFVVFRVEQRTGG